MNKLKPELVVGFAILFFCLAFYFLYGLLLPFFIGLILTFAVQPFIAKIQKIVRNRNIANVLFLGMGVATLLLFFLFFSQFINRDFQRLSSSFKLLASSNQDMLDETGQKVKDFIGGFYDLDQLEGDISGQADSLLGKLKEGDISGLDTESIKAAFEEFTAFFQSGDEPTNEESGGFGLLFIVYSSILYFILILFQYEYFEGLRKRYYNPNIKSSFSIIMEDFDKSFVKYFQLRSKIIAILALIYITVFVILDIPGIILITALIILLSYVQNLQYLALIPLLISSLVLSVETDYSFIMIFGLIVGLFILVTIIDDNILTPRIMEENIGLNPVLMVLGLSIWSYLLGTIGLLIGIPMTSLCIIYFKRYFISSYTTMIENKKPEN